MMKILTFLAVLAFSVFANPLDFKSIQSDFTQVVKSNDASVAYEGEFFVSDDNRAVWVYKTPTKKTIYFNENHVVSVEDELEQAIVSRLENAPNLAKILANAKKISENLYKANYDDVEYLITLKDAKPAVIDYKDKLENKIKITLKNVKINEVIADEKFLVKIPKGYDIITQ